MTAVSAINHVIIIGNITGAIYAFHWLRRAARSTNPKMRPVYAGSAALAVVYCLAYVTLLIMGNTHRTEWSEIKALIDLVAWVFVWARPAQNSVRVWEEHNL